MSETLKGIDGFLDTNVFLRYLVPEHPEHSPLARERFEQIERGDVSVYITDTVVFETVYTLQSHYDVSRAEIADALLRLLRLSGPIAADKPLLREVFALWVERRGLSFADCFHLLTARSMGLTRMITVDRKMSIPGVPRVEPPIG